MDNHQRSVAAKLNECFEILFFIYLKPDNSGLNTICTVHLASCMAAASKGATKRNCCQAGMIMRPPQQIIEAYCRMGLVVCVCGAGGSKRAASSSVAGNTQSVWGGSSSNNHAWGLQSGSGGGLQLLLGTTRKLRGGRFQSRAYQVRRPCDQSADQSHAAAQSVN